MSTPLPAGLYSHYKGGLYLLLGVGHDANADDLFTWDHEGIPLGEREVVVYVSLDGGKPGSPLSVRTRSDFEATVCGRDGCPEFGTTAWSDGEPRTKGEDAICGSHHQRPRFLWFGESR